MKSTNIDIMVRDKFFAQYTYRYDVFDLSIAWMRIKDKYPTLKSIAKDDIHLHLDANIVA